MSKDKISKHLDYLDGVLLAQSLVLIALVKHNPAAVANLKSNLEQIISQLEHLPLAQEKRRALVNTLDKIIGGQNKLTELID
ncbi:hypothetical protein Herbaro_17220 [Herbaspirillum sp. WKF16]|jgi:hypothetical protein|uniref:hypothetical protein n=1 Tax=Herbaspirillum sp. WKF16 TaxID=3028312 RepID=UPI0023A9E51F|nr:hypothetical protein [Herbaspirillum sp. WKF16]WDZ95214.1 hypothetical protein Herbaro_17220 [Herbaspirillum sp. WKF16]